MWEFWCEDFNIGAELWAKRRINLLWKMSQQMISLKFPPFLNTNTTREHVSREKPILSVFAHVLGVHHAAIYKRIEHGKKTQCFWNSPQMLMTDDSFVFIHTIWRRRAEIVKIGKSFWSNLMSWTGPDQKHGRSLVQIYSQDTKFVALFSGICELLLLYFGLYYVCKVPFKEKNLMITSFSCC